MTVAAAGAVGVPALVPSSALGRAGAVAPSNRIALGVVSGLGPAPYRGVREFLCQPLARIVAIADADPRRAESLRRLVERAGGSAQGKSSAPSCAQCREIGEIFARADVDALLVATLDDGLVGPAIAAVQGGKHLFCELPLATGIADGRALCNAIAAQACVFQAAGAAHAGPVYRRLEALVRGGQVGRLQRIGVQARDGVAAAALVDLAQRVNGTETIGPVEIEGRSARGRHVEYRYANGVVMSVDCGGLRVPPHDASRDDRPQDRWAAKMLGPSTTGIRFEGTAGWVAGSCGAGSTVASSRPIFDRSITPGRDGPDASAGSPYREFLDCVRAGRPSATAAEIAHRTATLVNLGAIAMRLGRKVQWNPYAEQFIDDSEGDALCARPAGVWMA
jgi:predicted dehydrogenase